MISSFFCLFDHWLFGWVLVVLLFLLLLVVVVVVVVLAALEVVVVIVVLIGVTVKTKFNHSSRLIDICVTSNSYFLFWVSVFSLAI